MRFDASAGGHQGVEREVGGLDPHGGLAEPKHLADPDPKAGTREAGVNAIYAGNFMQDFSQINVPMFHQVLAKLPKDPVKAAKGGESESIGAAGADAIADSLIRALAILDVGPRLAEVVVQNPQAYRPEQHVDQPIGYAASTDTMVQETGKTREMKDPDMDEKETWVHGALRRGRRTVIGGSGPHDKVGSIAQETVDKDRDEQLKGSAVPGLQVENPELFKVGAEGLQNHIYNSSEWIKNHWLTAARLGPTDEGRFHVGAGLHAIEDYFAHSNFIEVGLNSYIDFALQHKKSQPAAVGKFLEAVQAGEKDPKAPHSQQSVNGSKRKTHVDTLFDASVKGPGGRGRRQAVTTGSVGSNDMKSSIGHILLPKLPELEKAIDHSIDKMFDLVIDDPDKVSTWAKINQTAKEDRPHAAILALCEGLDKAGVTVPVPDGVRIIYGREIPLPFVDNIDVPTDAELTWANKGVKDALTTYIGFVKTVKSTIDDVKDALDTIKMIAFPLVWLVEKVIKKLEDMIKKELEALKKQIKHELNLFIVRMVDAISGVNVQDEAHRTIGDALHDAHERIEDYERQTSLQARLLPGGDLAKRTKEEIEPVVGPVEPGPHGGWVAKNALPPSHSEIAKDHAPIPPDPALGPHTSDNPIRTTVGGTVHQIGAPDTHPLDPGAQQIGGDHEAEEGSIFYGLARNLAVEVDRHVLRDVEAMWAAQGSLYGDAAGLDKSKEEVSHEAFTKEAAGRAKDEEKRAGHDHWKFAQSDPANQALLKTRPEVRQLLELVDLIISHPDDSSWWRTVFDDYVGAHPDEVAKHIRDRNAVRGARTTVAP